MELTVKEIENAKPTSSKTILEMGWGAFWETRATTTLVAPALREFCSSSAKTPASSLRNKRSALARSPSPTAARMVAMMNTSFWVWLELREKSSGGNKDRARRGYRLVGSGSELDRVVVGRLVFSPSRIRHGAPRDERQVGRFPCCGVARSSWPGHATTAGRSFLLRFIDGQDWIGNGLQWVVERVHLGSVYEPPERFDHVSAFGKVLGHES